MVEMGVTCLVTSQAMQHYDVDHRPHRLKGGIPPNLLESVELKYEDLKKTMREYMTVNMGENPKFPFLRITAMIVYIFNANQTIIK